MEHHAFVPVPFQAALSVTKSSDLLPPSLIRNWKLALVLGCLLPLLWLFHRSKAARLSLERTEGMVRIIEVLQDHPQWLSAIEPGETSTECFSRWIQETERLTEEDFYVPGFQPGKDPPNGDGLLSPDENCYAVIGGLSPDTLIQGSRVEVLLLDPSLVWRTDPERKQSHKKVRLRRPLMVVASWDGRQRLEKPSQFSWWQNRREDALAAASGRQWIARSE
ncbi:MAG: hypothetical protein AAGJ31_13000 [Verrucomicrobiota bacterium]